MNILITSAGRRVSLVRSFQKEIKKVYPQAKVFAADAKPSLSSACQVADGNFEVPRLDNPKYFQVLEQICRENEIALVVPTIDTELLPMANNKQRFLEMGVLFLVSDKEFVLKCRDKRMIHDFFVSKGIPVAKEYARDNYKLPLFIKPIDGSRSVDTFLIRKESDLTEYHFGNNKLMFLEYIDHDFYEEFTCDMYYDSGNRLKCVVPRKRIETRDGEVNKGLTMQNGLIPFLKEKLENINGAVGCLTAQFFYNSNNNNIYGIEINPRFGGGYPLSYLAGANFPEWIVKEYLISENLPDNLFDSWEKDLLMLRYDDEVLIHGYKG